MVWAKQTIIVSKARAKTRAEARRIAKRHADRMYTSRETSTSYRFRQKPVSDFKRSSFRTEKRKRGVSIVWGELKKK